MAMSQVTIEANESAKVAGLRYVNDGEAGIRRWRRGTGFVYVAPDGRRVRDERTLRRIRSLVIPPAWTDVWICSSERGHLQATGRDAKGRKQYRYHPAWRAVRDETKFERLVAFGDALPRLRARVMADLATTGLPREKVLATVVRLLDLTLIRVGNDEYARKNHSYGLTTLRDTHVDVTGARIHFHFRGKSGKQHAVEIEDKTLAKIVRRCQEIEGHELFQYVDEEGRSHVVESGHVNEYLRAVTGLDFTAKDFRTWAGTVLAAAALAGPRQIPNERRAKERVVTAIRSVAARLGNTPAVCRKSYIHPAVLETFLDEDRIDPRTRARPTRGLDRDEARVLALLRRHAKRSTELRASA
jgi:DNA topoisomerase-1